MRLETLQKFDQRTKGQKDKRTKKTKRKTKKKDKKAKLPRIEFDIMMSGQFRTLARFFYDFTDLTGRGVPMSQDILV